MTNIKLLLGKFLAAVFSMIVFIFAALSVLSAQTYQVPSNLTSGQRAMPFYTGKVLPTPQKAKYMDKQLPLNSAVVVAGSKVQNASAYIAMLRDRIKLHGGHLSKVSSVAEAPAGATVIILGSTQVAGGLDLPDIPHHSEAYILQARQYNSHHIVVLEGKDQQGLLWAVISFNQLVSKQHGKAYVRAADIVDYPYAKGRGYLLDPWEGNGSEWAWFCLQFKINKVIFPSGKVLHKRVAPSGRRHPDWRQKPNPDWIAQLHHIGQVLNPFGIEWYVGLRPINGKPEQKIHSGSEKDFDALYNVFSQVAAAGGNIMLSYDDHRFPISPADKKQFGTASKADIYLINKLYGKIRKNYPGAKMLFVPPYYMGPASNPHYPESRKKYLTAIGEHLPKSIGIFWTGPHVGESHINPSDYDWIKGYIHRKPWYWLNNRFGNEFHHMFKGYYYVGDPLDEFQSVFSDTTIFNQFSAITLNSTGTNMSIPVAGLMEYLWNPSAFDPDSTAEIAAKKIAGPKAYPALVKLNHAMSKLDPYHASVTPAAVQNMTQIGKDMGSVNAALKQALAASPAAVPFWTPMVRYVKLDRKLLRDTEKRVASGGMRKKVRKAIFDIQQQAKEEIGFNQAADVFLSPYVFLGGHRIHYHFAQAPPRFATWITNHAGSKNTSLSAGFQMNRVASGQYQLVLSGRAYAKHLTRGKGSGKHNCPIIVKVNHQTVYEGLTKFNKSTHHWSQGPLPPFPAKYLRKGHNSITITNTAPKHGMFMLNYAVLRPRK
jgi:hypothetical protein